MTQQVIPGLTQQVIPSLTEQVIPGLTGDLTEGYGEDGYIYFMTNQNNNVLYTGVTNSLKRRIQEHRDGQGSMFMHKYNCKKSVYFEVFPSIEQAIAREKQIKHFKRECKNELVGKINPNWEDLTGIRIIDPEMR